MAEDGHCMAYSPDMGGRRPSAVDELRAMGYARRVSMTGLCERWAREEGGTTLCIDFQMEDGEWGAMARGITATGAEAALMEARELRACADRIGELEGGDAL